MQKLIHHELWKKLRELARKSKSRRAAIAYVTLDHLGLRDGDQLVVDASEAAIRCGETSAKLLLDFHGRGVEIYSRKGLHAKVALFDDVAFVGSANMSMSSAERLDEAGVLTDHAGTVASVQALLSQWIDSSRQLTETRLRQLVSLPVSPRRGPAMIGGSRARLPKPHGDQVWVVGVRELRDGAYPREKEALDEGIRQAQKLRRRRKGELGWIRWTGKRGFGVQCRPGDIVFQIQTLLHRKRLYTLRPMTIVSVHVEPTCRRVHLEEFPGKMIEEMTLLQFQSLLASLGVKRKVGRDSNRALPVDVGNDAIRAWKRWRP